MIFKIFLILKIPVNCNNCTVGVNGQIFNPQMSSTSSSTSTSTTTSMSTSTTTEPPLPPPPPESGNGKSKKPLRERLDNAIPVGKSI